MGTDEPNYLRSQCMLHFKGLPTFFTSNTPSPLSHLSPILNAVTSFFLSYEYLSRHKITVQKSAELIYLEEQIESFVGFCPLIVRTYAITDVQQHHFYFSEYHFNSR